HRLLGLMTLFTIHSPLTPLHYGARRPPRAARRSGAEVREVGSRGHSRPRSNSEPTGTGEVSLDKPVLAVDETARLGRWPKHGRRATVRRISRSASQRRR